MHRTRLAGFIIDCQTDDLAGAAGFWSAALGMPQRALPVPEGDRYVSLDDGGRNLHIEVQKVEHPSRVHLDIGTDDVDAEVARLIGLGATVVERVQRWVVMQAPTGQRFCVIPQDPARFERDGVQWE